MHFRPPFSISRENKERSRLRQVDDVLDRVCPVPQRRNSSRRFHLLVDAVLLRGQNRLPFVVVITLHQR